MTTLMSWHNSEGTKGRCDAKCHNAKGDSCNCMCGGRYHGGGRDGTLVERVQEFGEQVLGQALEKAEAAGFFFEALPLADAADAIANHNCWRRRKKGGTVSYDGGGLATPLFAESELEDEVDTPVEIECEVAAFTDDDMRSLGLQ